MDIVTGRNGDSLSGKVLNKTFSIRTGFGEVSLKRSELWGIYFDTRRKRGPDEIRTKDSSSLSGTVLETHVEMEAEGQMWSIPTAQIFAVHFGIYRRRSARSLAEFAE